MSPLISIVIPTKDRPLALRETLASLERQEPVDGDFEVVVVDDGSAPAEQEEARRAVEAAAEQIEARLIRGPGGGPASARNAAAANAGGLVLLFLGDDTAAAAPDLLARHAELHRRRPEPSYAILGRITWTDRRAVTPFMRWLESGGPQFHFDELSPGPVPADTYFYSSHVSLKREVFERAGGFEERFPFAATEDTELGVRLAEAGIQLEYHPELVVLHDHPTTLSDSLRRQVRVGRSAALYNELRPDRPHPQIAPPEGFAWAAVERLAPLLDRLQRAPLPSWARQRLWLAMHRARYAEGYRLGSPSVP
jgi:GT2 family glycosyltransferase